MSGTGDRDELRRALRSSLRKATLYSYGFLAAAAVVALGGTALVAWALSLGAGLPFVATWMVLAAVVLVTGSLVAWLASGRDGKGAGKG